jgi:hypothetical protein
MVFNDIFYNLRPLLKGNQVLVGYGLGFGKRLPKQRVDVINNHIDLVFQTGRSHDNKCIKNGVFMVNDVLIFSTYDVSIAVYFE